MSEAEVSIRLALYLLRTGLTGTDIEVAIDGAQVQTAGQVHFALQEFLAASGCTNSDGTWQGLYRVDGSDAGIRIHSMPGRGDVVAKLASGAILRVESKKGPLGRSRSSVEYPLLREAIGQLMTIEQVHASDVLAVAVPHSPKFSELAARWRKAPLMERLGIHLLTVSRIGEVHGLPQVL